MSQLILSIDQGTTGTRATLYDLRGNARAQAYEEFPQIFPRPGWVEHRASDILRSVENTVTKVMAQKPKKDSVVCIGITNQRETVFAWDRQTGKALAHGIVWQCRRTADRCQEIKKKPLAEKIQKKTGLLVDAYFSASKMEWFLKNVPRIQKAREKKQLCFGTVDSFLLYHLTGGKVHATEPSNACRTMLYDIYQCRYDPGLLKAFHIPEDALPRVCPSAGTFGVTSGFPGLPDGIPITGILGDQQAALFGQGCTRQGMAKNTYGTGAFVLMNTGTKPFFSRKGLITSVAWQVSGRTYYCLEGSIFICGAVIQWLRDGLKLISHARDTETIARSVQDSHGVVIVPALVGLGAPHWDPYARGAILGITRSTTREHLVRAALESIALQVDEVITTMQEDARIRLKELRVDGGASSNNFLLQLQSNLIGRKVVRSDQESTSLGAAFMAGLGAGAYNSINEIQKFIPRGKAFYPEKQGDLRKIKMNWQKAVARAKEWAN